MGHVGSKTRSPGQVLGYSCLHSKRHICHSILMKLCKMFVLAISKPSSNMGHVGLKTRSLGQILGNTCLHSEGHICDLIFMTLSERLF